MGRLGVVIALAGCGHAREPHAALGKLPLAFEQTAAGFVARARGLTVHLTDEGAVIAPRDAPALRFAVVGGEPHPTVVGVARQRGEVHYLIGRDPAGWHSAATFAAVRYAEVYAGVDLVFHGHDQQLEYDFVIAPGHDPDRIALAIDGADRIVLAGGEAVIEAGDRELREHHPVAYQDVDGRRVAVDVAYVTRGERALGFRVGPYDRSRELVIDPVLTFSTFLGGNQGDSGGGIAVDPAGNVYVTGTTQLDDFPTKNPLQAHDRGSTNTAFVAKIDASGALVYSTYLGGSTAEVGNAIAVDGAGNAYVAGTTESTDFPTKNAPQATAGGMGDGFVAKLDPSGASLVYSTYLGGNTTDGLLAIAVDAAGNAYACGVTNGGFSTTNGSVQKTFGGNQDAFAVKLDATGAIAYATYLGGSGFDSAWGIAVDPAGDAYVVGQTDSTNFPTHAPLQARGGGIDAFVSELSPTGAAYVYSTYLGGAGDDTAQAVAVDGTGRAYVAGDSTGSFPTTASAYQRTYGGGTFDMFVARVTAGGTSLDYATYLGGAGNDFAHGIAIGNAGDAFVAGSTNAAGFPTVMPIQSYAGSFDGTLAELTATGSNLVLSTYLGGASSDGISAIAVDTGGAFYVTGTTSSTDFALAGALQPTYGGGASDVFVATDRTTPTRDLPLGGDFGDLRDAGTGGGKPGGCCESGRGSDGLLALVVGLILGIPRRSRAL